MLHENVITLVVVVVTHYFVVTTNIFFFIYKHALYNYDEHHFLYTYKLKKKLSALIKRINLLKACIN